MADNQSSWTALPPEHMSQEEGEKNLAAFQGLVRAEIGPLIALLRSGAPIGQMVRRELVRALEHDDEALIFLSAKRTRTGPGSKAQELWTSVRRHHIADFVQAQLDRQGSKKKTEAAVQAAMTHFQVSRSLVMDACKFKREYVARILAMTSDAGDAGSPDISDK